MATPPPPNDRESIIRVGEEPVKPPIVDRMIESQQEMRERFEQEQPVSTAMNPEAGGTVES